jgi:ergothioneine biosynthesis protein EgtB
MADLLDGADGDGPTTDLVELGLHHEQQHQELLLMDMKHVLWSNPLRPAYLPDAPPAPGGPAPAQRWIEHPGGPVEVGHDGSGFAFDNEAPRHVAQLVPHAISSRLVTCGDWVDFIEDGGYRRSDLWLSDGWAAIAADGWEAPLYWSGAGGDREIFTLHGSRPLDPAEPVCHISYYEADAYAHWAGARLPTEQEWEAVAEPVDTVEGPRFHPLPVTVDAPGAPAVWQWTSSAYSPYPGFRPAPGAVGEYNGKFMVNQQVLRGGACVTPPGHLRRTYRNFFPPPARWPFTGLRLAQDREG